MGYHKTMLMALRKSSWRGRVRDGSDTLSHTLQIKVWPTDMDVFMHMTNTRYFDVMQISADLLMSQKGIQGILKRENLRLKQVYSDLDVYSMLKLFQTYTLETAVAGADDGTLAISHTFNRGKRVNGRGLLLFSVSAPETEGEPVHRNRFVPAHVPPLQDSCRAWINQERLNPPITS
ncbi:MAG: thioesterase family protein [Pseudomonadota bacterium]